MIKQISNYSIGARTSMKAPSTADQYIEFDSYDDLARIKDLTQKNPVYTFLGDGSNLIFHHPYRGMIIKANFQEIRWENTDSEKFKLLIADSAVEWDTLVRISCEAGYYGLENLAYIPGSVGASPVQNIGAYGSEVKDSIEWVEGFNLNTGKIERKTNSECEFGYRNSIFKSKLKNTFLILKVAFRLSKSGSLKDEYANLKELISQKEEKTPLSMMEIITEIRKTKLPEIDVVPNSGSFFKNPTISVEQFIQIQKKYPEIPSYPVNNDLIKIPAAWLIDQLGWKGKMTGNVGIHKNQALVLINPGMGSADEILDLQKKIQESVSRAYGIILEREVNLI